MPAIFYNPFLAWAKDNVGLTIIAGQCALKLEETDDFWARFQAMSGLGQHVVPAALESMMQASVEDGPTDAELQKAVLAKVNAPIETGAKVVRETRDEAWLRRTFNALNWLAQILDGPAVPFPVVADAGDDEKTDLASETPAG